MRTISKAEMAGLKVVNTKVKPIKSKPKPAPKTSIEDSFELLNTQVKALIDKEDTDKTTVQSLITLLENSYPTPVQEWVFTVQRDKTGFISNIIARAKKQ